MIVISIPIIYPIGLPVKVSDYTQKTWEMLESLEAGDVVVMEYGAWPVMWDMSGPTIVALNKYFYTRDIKVINYCFEPTGVAVPMMRGVEESEPEKYGREYGEDYVIFGLVAGMEIGMASFAADMAGTYTVDYYGNPTTDIPLMQNVNSANDVQLVVSILSQGHLPDYVVRQWAQGYGTPTIFVTLWGVAPNILPYYPREAKGMLIDVEAGAELEFLSGLYGAGLALVDAKSVAGFLALAFFIAANIVAIGLKVTTGEVSGRMSGYGVSEVERE
jgi:hypothetical protein